MSNENYDTKVLETLSARLALVEKAIGADKLQEAKSAMSDAELEAVAGGRGGGGDRYLSDDEIDRQRRRKKSQASMENYHER